MSNDQNSNNDGGAFASGQDKEEDIVIHTMQGDLEALKGKAAGAATVTKSTAVVSSRRDADGVSAGGENKENASPFLNSAAGADSFRNNATFSDKKETVEEAGAGLPKKEKKTAPAIKKTGFFGLGNFFKKSEKIKEAPRSIPVAIVEPTQKISEPREAVKKPPFTAPTPAAVPAQKIEVKVPAFAAIPPAIKEEIRKPIFAAPVPVKKEIFTENKAVMSPLQLKKELTAEKAQPVGGGLLGIFKSKEKEQTEAEIKELKKTQNILEQKNKELDQARIALEEKVRQYTGELKAIKENEEKLSKHTQELRVNEHSLDQQVMERNRILKEKIKQFEEFREKTKEKEERMLSLKTQIEQLEKEILTQEEKIKKTQEKTGLFGMIRKMRNRKLIETGEKLRKIHYALEKKNGELKQSKDALEEGIRKHLHELKVIKENEEKTKRHLAELKKNETDMNQQRTRNEQELQEKFEQLKVGLEQQVREKNKIIKEQLEKLAEINTNAARREQQLVASQEKINKIEQEITAKNANAQEILKKAEQEIAAKEAAAQVKLEGVEKEIATKKTSAQEILKKAEQEIAAKEAAAKIKLEGVEKEIATKKTSAQEMLKKAEQEIAAKEAAAQAKLEKLEKAIVSKETATKEVKKETSRWSLFGKKSEQKEEETKQMPEAEGITQKSAAPFAVKNEMATNVKTVLPVQANSPLAQKEQPAMRVVAAQQKTGQLKKPHWGRVLAVSLSLIIILVVFAGSYIFSKTRNSEVAAPPTQKEPIVEPPIIEVAQVVFSEDKPNYLSIDVEGASALEITQSLISAFVKIKEAKIATPVEFLITDANNNPLAFAVFAKLFDLNLSAEVLSNLEEGFSLFIYNDSDSAKLILAVDMKNKDGVVAGLLVEEKGLSSSLKPIFLGDQIEQSELIFNEGQYNGRSVRYANLNSQNTTSLDYVFTEDQWVIGTSKDALRTVVDKISGGASEE